MLMKLTPELKKFDRRVQAVMVFFNVQEYENTAGKPQLTTTSKK